MDDDIIIENFIQEIKERFTEISIRLDKWMVKMGYEIDHKMFTSMMEEFSQATTDAINEYLTLRSNFQRL